jgi:hypothetical protein
VRPKAVINVGYDMKLVQPRLPMGRYTFRLKVFYEIEDGGKRYAVQQDAIEMKFRDRDLNDVLAWCTSQVETHLERHRKAAQQLHPHSRVVVSPPPKPAELEPVPPEALGAGEG